MSEIEIGSTQLSFTPKTILGGEYQFDIGTAGSTILLAQTVIPILLHAKTRSKVQINGGTHVIKSPGFDYFQQVFIQAIHKFGASIHAKLLKPGYYPKGGGHIEFVIEPSKLTGNSDWPKRNSKNAIIRYARLPTHIPEREAHVLQSNGIDEITIYHDHAFSPGNTITLWQGFCGAYTIGERGKPAEQVANEAINLLMQENTEVDRYLADQLLIYAVVAKGESRYRTSLHTPHFKTNLHMIKRFYQRNIELNHAEVVIY